MIKGVIGIIGSDTAEAKEAALKLGKHYDLITLTDSKEPNVDVIIALGGDGFMLHTLHDVMSYHIPIYGMNCGTTGFLMNEYREEDLIERLANARPTNIYPLRMTAIDSEGVTHEALAINDVSLLRHTRQAAKLQISIDDQVSMEEMVCDGALVSTPAGSSAYNFSSGGPIIPLKSELLALTPISPFRPRRWRGAILPNNVTIRFDVLEPNKRPINAVADFTEIQQVVSVNISVDRSQEIQLLFDPGHSLEERILREQFTV